MRKGSKCGALSSFKGWGQPNHYQKAVTEYTAVAAHPQRLVELSQYT